MAEYLVEPRKITRAPVHPGVIFAEEIMPALRERHTIAEIARLLGVSRATLHRLMAGEIALSPDMAVRIGKLGATAQGCGYACRPSTTNGKLRGGWPGS